MSLSANSLRRHGFAHVRRRITSGDYSKKELAAWEKEYGRETVQALFPAEPSKTTSPPEPTTEARSES